MAGKSMKVKSARWHTIYSIISTVIETAALAVAIIWFLPLFDIVIPWWGTILILFVFLVYSYIMYRIGHPTILYESISAPESIIGTEGVVEVDLNPEGYVRVRGELWKASGSNGPLMRGDEVTVTSLTGMKITVKKKIRPL
jgi:membrane protein implicated in regulation of membrane protease activity